MLNITRYNKKRNIWIRNQTKVFELKIEGRKKRSRPVKRWIDVVEEDMKKRGVVQQDAGDREGWRQRAVKGLANGENSPG